MDINAEGIKPSTLVDQVEKKILSYIKENKLTIGDSIPNEADLATSLNVGRSVVREALSRLRMLGLVESRTRRGMVIREPSVLNSLNKIISPYLLGDETIFDLLGFRIALEVGITDLIFNNIKDEDIKELEEIIERQQVLNGSKLTIKSELEFHNKLYQITQNKVIRDMQAIIIPLFTYLNEHFHEFIPFNEKFSKKRKLIKHEDLLSFLKKKNKEGYRDAIVKHFESYIEFINHRAMMSSQNKQGGK